MKEYQIRTPDLNSITRTLPCVDVKLAIEIYQREYADVAENDMRRGMVLVQAEWESDEEADRARLDWMQNNGEPTGFFFDSRRREWRDDYGEFRVTLRSAIDVARGAPTPKVTVIERLN